jgi:peroxiredoxin (alkyl hydroperoxide reductase subunit C)
MTNEVHFAWLNTQNNGGIEGVTYPILADTNRNLSNILDSRYRFYSVQRRNRFSNVEGSNVTFELLT